MALFHNTPPLVFSIFMLLALSACSNPAKTNNDAKTNVVQEVQLGTVMAVKYTKVKRSDYQRSGSVGVTIGSGGSSGVYGSMDVSRMFDVLGNKKPEANNAQEQTITIRRKNGEVIAITQPITEHFNRGDKVKITKLNGKAHVSH